MGNKGQFYIAEFQLMNVEGMAEIEYQINPTLGHSTKELTSSEVPKPQRTKQDKETAPAWRRLRSMRLNVTQDPELDPGSAERL